MVNYSKRSVARYGSYLTWLTKCHSVMLLHLNSLNISSQLKVTGFDTKLFAFESTAIGGKG